MSQPQLLSAWAGHWTGAGTGVTVIVPPPGTVASGEVRGGAPATREFALLDPTRLVDRVDAVVLSGGSAFGLAAGGRGDEPDARARRGVTHPARPGADRRRHVDLRRFGGRRPARRGGRPPGRGGRAQR
ncbi:P1 family peptidase [Micromonosporaceae bacterium Da 78-11]